MKSLSFQFRRRIHDLAFGVFRQESQEEDSEDAKGRAREMLRLFEIELNKPNARARPDPDRSPAAKIKRGVAKTSV
jgi:hypothetical protein